MSELAFGALLIGSLVFLVLLGVHIAVALIGIGFVGIWLMREDVEMAMRLLYLSAYNGVADYIFATIPLFVLMGLLVSISNVGKDTFDVAESLLRRVRVGSLERPPTAPPEPSPPGPLVSDTGELTWHIAPDGRGPIAVDAPASQALIGFVAFYLTCIALTWFYYARKNAEVKC